MLKELPMYVVDPTEINVEEFRCHPELPIISNRPGDVITFIGWRVTTQWEHTLDGQRWPEGAEL